MPDEHNIKIPKLEKEKESISSGEFNVTIGPIEELNNYNIANASSLIERFNSYAPPNVWGVWNQVASHGGRITFNISYKTLGDTVVYGQVNYYSEDDWKTEDFFESVTIRTGNAWAQVKVRFKGVPLGSAVEGTVTN